MLSDRQGKSKMLLQKSPYCITGSYVLNHAWLHCCGTYLPVTCYLLSDAKSHGDCNDSTVIHVMCNCINGSDYKH